jgi:Arc/MetJ-type ribon-helix-helix transcriptional regulator
MVKMSLTTIQIPEAARKRLKILAACRGISYTEALEDLIDLYEAIIPFKTLEEFREWFEQNLEKFGFKKILEKKAKPPIYVLEDGEGKTVKVAVEFFAKDFSRKGYGTAEADLVVCIFSPSPKVSGVPTISLLKLGDPQELLKTFEGRRVTVTIPAPLYRRVEKTIAGTGFSSPSAYITFILREILAEKEMDKREHISGEDEEKVKERLRALGYL